MTRIIRSSSPLIIVLCLLLAIQFVGCGGNEDEGDNPEGDKTSEAPPMPPTESMMIDLSVFDEEAKAPSATAQTTYQNYGNAVARVAAINSAFVASLSLPSALFGAVRFSPATQQADGSWLWTYNYTYQYLTFTAKLTALKTALDTSWSMKLSCDSPLYPINDFEWYKGVSTAKNTSGTWEFFDIQKPTQHNPLVNIDWSIGAGNEFPHLNVENVNTESEYNGDSMIYQSDAKMASISYEDISASETWDIIWDVDTGAGSLMVPGYNEGKRACWNELKQDIQCE